jgi:hypothetical protein
MESSMAEIRPFPPAKFVCGIIAANDARFGRAASALAGIFGPIDGRSGRFSFDFSDYYQTEMGPGLRRGFLSFSRLVQPEDLSAIKVRTNALEKELGRAEGIEGRAVNLDPGIITAAALIMATAKDFAHRVPLRDGIYGHLEFLFGRGGIRLLDWTYPDFRDGRYTPFFLEARKGLLEALRAAG